jgi:hypothetical protein
MIPPLTKVLKRTQFFFLLLISSSKLDFLFVFMKISVNDTNIWIWNFLKIVMDCNETEN